MIVEPAPGSDVAAGSATVARSGLASIPGRAADAATRTVGTVIAGTTGAVDAGTHAAVSAASSAATMAGAATSAATSAAGAALGVVGSVSGAVAGTVAHVVTGSPANHDEEIDGSAPQVET